MKRTARQEERLKEIAYTYQWWEIDVAKDCYSGYSMKYAERHNFTKEDLDAIDPCVHKVLTYHKAGSKDYESRHVMLEASVDIMLNPERKVHLNGEDVYWQAMTAIEAYDDGLVEVMFETPKHVNILSDGTIVASNGLAHPNKEMPWSFWESLFPGIEKYYGIANTMGMDRFDAASYCQGMLFDRENMVSDVNVDLPSDLVSDNEHDPR